MPRVPTYQPFQVQPSVGPGPAFSGPRGPGAAEIAGEQLQQMGQAIGQAGEVMGRFALAEQEKINTARLRDLKHQFRNEIQQVELEMSELKGAELVSGDEPAMERFNERVLQKRAELEGQLSNDWLQRNFATVADDLFYAYSDRALAYEAEQSQFYKLETLKAEIVVSGEDFALDPTPENLATLKANLQEMGADYEGLADQALDVFVQDSLDELVTAQIEVLLDRPGGVAAAGILLGTAQGEISRTARESINATLKEKEDEGRIIGIVQGWVSQGKTRQEAYDLALKEDPDDIEAIEERIYRVYNRQDAADQEVQHNLKERYGDQIRSGVRFEDIPLSVRRQMDQGVLDYLERLDDEQNGVMPRQTDMAALVESQQLMISEGPTAAYRYVVENADKFSTADFEQYTNKYAGMIKDPQQLESSLTNNQYLQSIGVTDQDQRIEVLGAYDNWYQEYQVVNGKLPSILEQRDQLDALTTDDYMRSRGRFGGTKFVSGMAGEQDVAGYARSMSLAAVEIQQQTGVAPERQDMERLLARAQQYFEDKGIANPTGIEMRQQIMVEYQLMTQAAEQIGTPRGEAE